MAEPCECAAAIADLHDFFAAWYRGEPTADISTLESALAADFRLVTPKATVVERAAIVDATRRRHGGFPNSQIEIKPVACSRARGLHLSTYEEHQIDDTERSVRLSTAVLSSVGDGWSWHLVHETWLNQGPSAG